MKRLGIATLHLTALLAFFIPAFSWADEVDGHYKGTSSSTGACSGGGPTEMMIKNRSFIRHFGPNQQFEVTVAPDGSVTSQFGQSSLTGTVKNGHADIDMVSSRGNCRVHQVMDKS